MVRNEIENKTFFIQFLSKIDQNHEEIFLDFNFYDKHKYNKEDKLKNAKQILKVLDITDKKKSKNTIKLSKKEFDDTFSARSLKSIKISDEIVNKFTADISISKLS